MLSSDGSLGSFMRAEAVASAAPAASDGTASGPVTLTTHAHREGGLKPTTPSTLLTDRDADAVNGNYSAAAALTDAVAAELGNINTRSDAGAACVPLSAPSEDKQIVAAAILSEQSAWDDSRQQEPEAAHIMILHTGEPDLPATAAATRSGSPAVTQPQLPQDKPGVSTQMAARTVAQSCDDQTPATHHASPTVPPPKAPGALGPTVPP